VDYLANELSVRTQLVAEHPCPKEIYLALVKMLYSQVRASVPLLEAARRVAEERAHEDPVAAGMIEWFRHHAEEERHHDQWLLEDWASLGNDPAELVNWPGSPTMAQAVGSTYYWSLHAHPVAMLGYCTVLEGSPPSAKFIDTLQTRSGFPERAFETLRHHSDIDDDHASELYELIDSLSLTPWHESIMGMTAMQTVDLLIVASDELLASLPA
jgi:hypothetical protein